jgi:hypothetical protein
MAVKFTKPEINVREKLAELDKPSGIAGEAMLRAETPQEQQALIGVGRRNLLINGGFDVWQRSTSATIAGASGYGQYIAADRWSAYYGGTKIEAKEYTINNEFKHAMRITSTTGNSVYAYQTIEGGSTLSNQTLTYSYWARANRVAVISGNNTWRYGGVNSDTPVYNVAGAASLNSHHVDTEWRKITHTVTLINDSSGPSFDRHLFFLLSLDDTVTNDWLEVAEVQIERGKVATPFEHRSYGEELALCQRYYERFITNDNNRPLANYWAAGHANLWIPFKVEKRAAPTVSATIGQIYNGGWVSMTAIQATPTGTTGDSDGVSFMVQSSGGSAGYAAFARNFTATFDAEL